jgi:hypothetical protein
MATIKLKQKLIFDKVAVTMHIDEFDRMALLARINDPELQKEYSIKVYRSNGGRYKNNYQIPIYKGNTIELAMYPINKGHNFFRLEYNPSKLRKEGRKRLRSFLIKLLGIEIVKTIYFEALVTRLDLTLDVFDMEPGLFIYKKRVQQSQVFRGENESMASQVLGSESSNCRITMYDKHLEQGMEGKTNYQRIEIRLRKLNVAMAYLNTELLCELLALYFYNDGFLTDPRFTEEFGELAYSHGLNFALALLDENTRLCYQRYLETYRAFPIDQDDLDFEKAHRIALGSLIHPDCRDRINSRAA